MWEAAEPLDTAWAEFVVLLDRVAQMPLRTHPTKGIAFGLDHQRARKTSSTKRSDRTHLLDAIYAGRLWAIGLRRGLSGAQELVRVPSEYFAYGEARNRTAPVDRAHISWGKGELTITGISYLNIRIFRAPVSEGELMTAGCIGKPVPHKRNFAKRKLGRPKSDPVIGRTAKRLWKADLKFQTLPLKGMVQVVRGSCPLAWCTSLGSWPGSLALS
jgi:hypothetical protein